MKKNRNKSYKLLKNELEKKEEENFLKESVDFIWKQVLPVEKLDDALSDNYNRYIIANNHRKY